MFVSNLPFTCDWMELKRFFSTAGQGTSLVMLLARTLVQVEFCVKVMSTSLLVRSAVCWRDEGQGKGYLEGLYCHKC